MRIKLLRKTFDERSSIHDWNSGNGLFEFCGGIMAEWFNIPSTVQVIELVITKTKRPGSYRYRKAGSPFITVIDSLGGVDNIRLLDETFYQLPSKGYARVEYV